MIRLAIYCRKQQIQAEYLKRFQMKTAEKFYQH